MKTIFAYLAPTLALLTAALPSYSKQQSTNVIVMLVDDLGQTDLGCYGSTFHETPHLDKLAKDSLKFTQASSACTVCSPTRASLLLGKYPARHGITDWISGHDRPFAPLLPPPDWPKRLASEETTLAEMLTAAGHTCASIGKWHLGEEDSYPQAHGFSVNIAGTHRGQPPSYFSPYGIPTLKDGPAGEFLTDREAAETCAFIDQCGEKPFFVYLPFYAVHTPIQAKKDVAAKYQGKLANNPDSKQKTPKYAALLESVDDAVGRIRSHLEAKGLWENTALIFTGDNGGLLNITHNLGLRAGKGSAYEGGTRVPLIVRWPGLTTPGTTCSIPVVTPDIFATISANIKLKDPDAANRDGENLSPLFDDPSGKDWKRDAIYWHYPHYHPGGATPYSSIRLGDHKLIHFFEDGQKARQELYDLKADPAEQQDLAPTKPELAKVLFSKLEAHWKLTKAKMPIVNPKADPIANAKKK